MVLAKAREILSKEKDFYVLVYNVLEKYDYSGAIIEYCFKMILNMLQDRKPFFSGFNHKFPSSSMLQELLIPEVHLQIALPLVSLQIRRNQLDSID